jgi:hypothetical protein
MLRFLLFHYTNNLYSYRISFFFTSVPFSLVMSQRQIAIQPTKNIMYNYSTILNPVVSSISVIVVSKHLNYRHIFFEGCIIHLTL